MGIFEWIGAVLALGILVYLLVALLAPEKLS
jgi:K+-transporting ATPase KdpF subunit